MNSKQTLSVDKLTYVFVGNRRFVLDQMIEMKLRILKIFAVKGSHLERQLNEESIDHIIISNKNDLLDYLYEINFDCLVLNGCPYILPIYGYLNENPILLNIHPSYLPDLRGSDPVPGAMLYKKDSGATCHQIDKGIDTGPIISQVKIPYTKDLDVQLLYQLSFLAEKEAFRKAYSLSFMSIPKGEEININSSYFTISPSDQQINFNKDTNDLIIRKSKAFGNSSRGVTFSKASEDFITFSVSTVDNPYLKEIAKGYNNGDIIMKFERSIIIKLNNEFLRMDSIKGNLDYLQIGSNLLL